VHDRQPSNNIVKSVGPLFEFLFEKTFFFSPVIALIAAAGALLFFMNGAIAPGVLALLAVVCAMIGVYARFYVPFQLRVTRLNTGELGVPSLQSPGRQPFKVVFFSDLHAGLYKRQAWGQRIVDAVNAESPDVVLIGGDFVGKTECCDLKELLAPLAGLKPRVGAYAVLGNHDYGLPDIDHSQELIHLLHAMNIRVIHNECVPLRDDLRLLGVDEIWTEKDDLAGALARCEACAERTLVLGHNPDLILRLGEAHESLRQHGAFFLFGHTHHGQIHLPFAPGLAVPIKSEYYRGMYHIPFGAMYVSAGVGESGTPTRLNTWPEIVVFEI
jgi:predicted MPP superfamily phosphohydrolase